MNSNNKKMKQETTVKILSLLNEFDLSERIEIIERIGKRLRQRNSIEISNDVSKFTQKTGNKKRIDEYPA